MFVSCIKGKGVIPPLFLNYRKDKRILILFLYFPYNEPVRG